MMQQQNKKKINKENNGRKRKEEEETPTSNTTTVVLNVDMSHHNGCTSKILRYLRGAQGMKVNVIVGGVKDNYAKAESEARKLAITGKMDPSEVKKKIDLISSVLNNNKDKNNNKSDNKKPKEPTVTTVVLKVELHCHGCMERIRNTISKTKGVQEVAIDKEKEIVTVKGTMEAKALVGKLMRRLRRTVEVVPISKKDKDKKEVDKEKVKETAPDKGGKSGGATTAKKKKDGGGKGGEDGGDDSEKMMKQCSGLDFPPPTLIPYGYGFNYEPLYMSQVYAPQMFSDENPNACFVM